MLSFGYLNFNDWSCLKESVVLRLFFVYLRVDNFHVQEMEEDWESGSDSVFCEGLSEAHSCTSMEGRKGVGRSLLSFWSKEPL